MAEAAGGYESPDYEQVSLQKANKQPASYISYSYLAILINAHSHSWITA